VFPQTFPPFFIFCFTPYSCSILPSVLLPPSTILPESSSTLNSAPFCSILPKHVFLLHSSAAHSRSESSFAPFPLHVFFFSVFSVPLHAPLSSSPLSTAFLDSSLMSILLLPCSLLLHTKLHSCAFSFFSPSFCPYPTTLPLHFIRLHYCQQFNSSFLQHQFFF
jgi:hypothetical protein